MATKISIGPYQLMILVMKQMVKENAIKKQRESEYCEAILKRAVNFFKSNDSAVFFILC